MKLVNSMKWGSLVLALVSANAFAQVTTGRIYIEKDPIAGSTDTTTEFEFDTSYSPNFKLKLGGGVYHDVAALTNHTVTELDMPTWGITGIRCEINTVTVAGALVPGGTVSIHKAGDAAPAQGTAAAGFQAGDDTVTINVLAGGVVECHYTNRPEATIKIVKKVELNTFEPLPAPDGRFDFRVDLPPPGFASGANGLTNTLQTFRLGNNEVQEFRDTALGVYTFWELSAMIDNVATPAAGDLIESPLWDVTKIECRCLNKATCSSTFSFDGKDGLLDINNPLTPNSSTDDRRTLAKLTIDLKAGETVICEVFNKAEPCPPEAVGPIPAAGGSSNDVVATNNSANAGLATTDLNGSDEMGGCSSTGTGVAGLTTILMLLASLVAVRGMRRVRAKN